MYKYNKNIKQSKIFIFLYIIMHLKDNNNTYNTIYHKRHYISQSETLIILIQLNTKKINIIH